MGSLVGETFHRVGAFLSGHPAVAPLALLALVVAVVAAGPVARRAGCGRPAAAALVLVCLLPLVLTLPPATDTDSELLGRCRGVRPPAGWGRGGEELANLVMLAPAGLLLVALLRRRAAVVGLAAAAAYPVLAEAVQLLVPALRRECEGTDVLLNLAGLAAGAVVGLLVRGARRPLSPSPTAPGPRPTASRGT